MKKRFSGPQIVAKLRQADVLIGHIVAVLFYKLIFHAIGYSGKYKNYGLHGWPLEDFPKISEKDEGVK